jgi:hypothetical protein
MESLTTEMLHPFQSTIDLDGTRTDRETVQDIAFDGEAAGRMRCHVSRVGVTRNGKESNTGRTNER